MERNFYEVEELNKDGEWIAGTGSYVKKDAENFAEEVEQYHPGQPGRVVKKQEFYSLLIQKPLTCSNLSKRTDKCPEEIIIADELGIPEFIQTYGVDEFKVTVLVHEEELPETLGHGFLVHCMENENPGDDFGAREWDMTNLFFSDNAAEDFIHGLIKDEEELWKDEPDDTPAKVRSLSRRYNIRKIEIL